MECMTRGYFFVAESRIFPSENDVEAIINTRIKVTKARVPRSRFIAFMRRQIELLCWNWTKSDFDAELDEFLESESSSSADIPVANVPLVVSLTETHRRMLFVRRFLDEFCKEARLPIRLSFFEASSMPNPLGIRFRLNLDSLAPHLEAFADFCMRRNVDMPDDVFKRLPNFFGDKVRQFSRVPAHRLENEIVSHIYMNVGRWHFVSIVNRFVSDIIRGDVPLTVEAFRDWVREEKEVLDFREGAPKWEVHTIFRKRILPLCKARDEFNAIQREPPVRIKCLMPPSQPGRVVVAYVEGDVLEKNKAAFRALAKREQQ